MIKHYLGKIDNKELLYCVATNNKECIGSMYSWWEYDGNTITDAKEIIDKFIDCSANDKFDINKYLSTVNIKSLQTKIIKNQVEEIKRVYNQIKEEYNKQYSEEIINNINAVLNDYQDLIKSLTEEGYNAG